MPKTWDIEKAQAGFEPECIRLWGAEYLTIDITKDVQEQIEQIDLDDVENEENEKAIIKLFDLADVLLVPQNGGGAPSAVLREKWDAGTLTMTGLTGLMSHLIEGVRPT